MNVYPVADLRSATELVAAVLLTPPEPLKIDPAEILAHTVNTPSTSEKCAGQMSAKRALEIAIAGGTQHLS